MLRGSRDGWQANSDFISGQWVPISATNLHLLKTAECCSSIKQPVSWDRAPDIQEEMLFLTKENRRPGPHTLRKLCARSPDRWTGIGKGNSCGSCLSLSLTEETRSSPSAPVCCGSQTLFKANIENGCNTHNLPARAALRAVRQIGK